MIPRDGSRDVWLFGYGSLIWKADFGYVERVPATLHGWERRFWQGSHDHRGTPEQPGRVVTLIRSPQAHCVGMAYRIARTEVTAVLDHLDFREKNGYDRFEAEVHFFDSQDATDRASTFANNTVAALVYIATPDNFAHLGEASDDAIAKQIESCAGPSGTNLEYLLELHRSLLKLGVEDPHINRLVDLLRQIG